MRFLFCAFAGGGLCVLGKTLGPGPLFAPDAATRLGENQKRRSLLRLHPAIFAVDSNFEPHLRAAIPADAALVGRGVGYFAAVRPVC
jgi:hypothetical protein